MKRPVEILLIEDDPSDVDLTREAMRDGGSHVNLTVVEDGVKALAYLRREDPHASAVRPDLILLDLNLPRKDGREVLREIKRDAQLKQIPVVILTTSDAEADVSMSYELGGNCYITKPFRYEQFAGVLKAVEEFWLSVAKLPMR